MDSRNATVDHPLNDQKKLVQLNALLDKAKLYSQFIGQQVQESTANIYSSEKAKAEENSANIEEVKVRKCHFCLHGPC
jgi:F0F1-type ATP synthase membrane subunit b/b'